MVYLPGEWGGCLTPAVILPHSNNLIHHLDRRKALALALPDELRVAAALGDYLTRKRVRIILVQCNVCQGMAGFQLPNREGVRNPSRQREQTH
jgi:hypothetical protein